MGKSPGLSNIVRMLVVVAALAFPAAILAGTFARGTGEPNDPYQIATAGQLVAIGSDPNLFKAHFILTEDIDLDPNLPGGRVFDQPVMQWSPTPSRSRSSGQSTDFYGSFDGGGHTIRNFSLRTAGYPGFFRQISERAVVRDLRLENVTIVNLNRMSWTGPYGGALAAINLGTVINCSATGTLESCEAGGLVGENQGLVAGCRARCSMVGVEIGGLIGINDTPGRVVLCGADGVLGGEVAGGLVASNTGTIQFCMAGGSVSGGLVGGLAADNRGMLRESYATAAVAAVEVPASAHGGGLASSNEGTIVNCYATGPVSGSQSDGLVSTNNGTILSSYSTTVCQFRRPAVRHVRSVGVSASAFAEKVVRYVYYLDPNALPDQGGSPYEGYGVALAETRMKQAASFVGFDFYADANDGPAGHWFMPPDGHPVLTWQTGVTGLAGVPDVLTLSPEQTRLVLEAAGLEPNGVSYDYARPVTFDSSHGTWTVDTKDKAITGRPVGYLSPGSPVEIVVSLGEYRLSANPGNGSEANPYQIATAGQLDSLYDKSIPAAQHIVLTTDIDLSAYSYAEPLIRTVYGEFNGNGHTIRGPQIVASTFSSYRGALFGAVESSGVLHDLIVDQACVYGADRTRVGVLVGENLGQVLRCRAAGQVFGGYSTVGGLVGTNGSGGQLADCSFTGRVRPRNGAPCVGGLVGSNMGSILHCCARDVDVGGGDHVGGLAGESGYSAGVIEACYATGVVRGVNGVGGLIGANGVVPRVAHRSILVQEQPAARVAAVANSMTRDCYAACSVEGKDDIGGCIGVNATADVIVESCFFLALGDGGGPDNGLAVALTASQMMRQAGFTDWDFVDTWTICEGEDYPRLRWEGVTCGE